jgi:hypothetical protein
MSYVRVPPDSTGKKVYTKEQVVGLETVQAQGVHLADSEFPENLQAIDVRGSASVRFAEGQPIMAGFGSLKVSQQRALGAYESSQDSYDDLFLIETAVGAESIYEPISSSHVLRTTGSAGSKVMRMTKRYHYYLPGTSNYINMTNACSDLGKVGNIRRWGAFDDNDGLFFELNGTELNVVIRSSVTGSVVESKVARANWNNDLADGNGLSNYVLDITKVNIWWMDYQWLGAGRVCFGLVEPDGSRLTLHTFKNAGQLPLPYMRTGTLPLRTENENIANTGSGSELRELCMAMYTEGDFEDYTFWRLSDMEVSNVTVSGVNQHVLSVRSKPTINGKHNAIQAYPETLNVYTTQPVSLTIWQNVVLTGESWDLISEGSLEGNFSGTMDTSTALKFTTIYFDAGVTRFDISKMFEINDEGIMAIPNGTSEVWGFSVSNLSLTDATFSLSMAHKELW